MQVNRNLAITNNAKVENLMRENIWQIEQLDISLNLILPLGSAHTSFENYSKQRSHGSRVIASGIMTAQKAETAGTSDVTVVI